MATNKHKEEGPETVSESSLAMLQMTIEEKERAMRAAIEALKAQMQLDELEDRLHYLQLEREKRKSCQPGVVQDGDVMAIPTILDDSERPS